MPYADPEKARESAKLRQRARRTRLAQEALRGDDAPQEAARKIPDQVAQAVVITPTPMQAANMTREEWARQLVALGISWVNHSHQLLPLKPRDAVRVGMAGVNLVNANIVFLPSDRDGEPQRGSLAVVDKKFLNDPIFREHATGLLRRKRELMEAAEATGA